MILSQRSRASAEARKNTESFFSMAATMTEMGKRPIDLMWGNPTAKPGPDFYRHLADTVAELSQSNQGNPHAYPDNLGLLETRRAVARHMCSRTQLNYTADQIMMIAGCANGLDVCFASLLEPGAHDEVILFTPGFMEYHHYITLNQGVPVGVATTPDFQINYHQLERAITPRTRALVLNYPNNPTGTVLSAAALSELGDFLTAASTRIGREIVVLEDSPYDQLWFEQPAPIFADYYPNSIYITSFSKTHGLAGERIGFLALHPQCGGADEHTYLRLALANNLRFRVVNAPTLMQRVITRLGCEASVNRDQLIGRMRRLEAALVAGGFKVVPSQGGFFTFAQLPEDFEDNQTWQQAATTGEEPLLALPGAIFGGAAYQRYLRFSVTADDQNIARACSRIAQICVARHQPASA